MQLRHAQMQASRLVVRAAARGAVHAASASGLLYHVSTEPKHASEVKMLLVP
jgi:hypothetical protein